MRHLIKGAAAFALGLCALGVTAASADDDHRDRDHDRYERGHDDDRYDDRRGDRRYDDRRGDRRYDDRRYSDNRYRGGRPDRCDIDHDHRLHARNYYDFYPRDRYYRADPTFSVSFGFGNGYYDRGGRYYNNPYYDRRGYRDYGRVVDRDVVRIRGYRADAIIVEEVFPGRRGAGLVCTVTARGPDARFVPYGQLRSIANRRCSRRADIRVYA